MNDRINWRNWRLGLIVALLLSLLTAGAGLTEDMSWRAFIAVFCVSAITHMGTFLYQHPVEKVSWSLPRTITSLFIAFLLVSAVIACKSPQRVAYNTIATEVTLVNTAYTTYIDQILQGRASTNDFPKITRAYQGFQLAAQVAIKLANFNTNAPSTYELHTNAVGVASLIYGAR